MKIKFSAEVVTTSRYIGVELNLPDDVVNGGLEAITQWAKANVRAVDNAQLEWCESVDTLEVIDVTSFQKM